MARQQLLIKYYLQQQMASKDGKRVEMMALRSSRRGKSMQSKEDNHQDDEHCPAKVESKEHHNQIEEHKQQQLNPKNEKESTSPPNTDNQPVPVINDKSRRVTRSTALISKKICSQIDIHNDQLTPQDNPVSKVSEEPTSKKMLKIPSAQSLPQNVSHDLTATVKKPIIKILENITSPYSEVRKSYRKIHRKEIISIPYRKCHDAFQARIVTIINKIESGKNCLRDFESLIQRMHRINGKDMMNRYIIAGIRTIIRLTKQKDIYDVLNAAIQIKLIDRLQQEQKRLRQKIIQELQRMDGFELNLQNKNQQFIDSRQYKKMLVRKIYKIMKSKYKNQSKFQIKQKALNQCEKFYSCETNVGNLIRFIKHKMDFSLQ